MGWFGSLEDKIVLSHMDTCSWTITQAVDHWYGAVGSNAKSSSAVGRRQGWGWRNISTQANSGALSGQNLTSPSVTWTTAFGEPPNENFSQNSAVGSARSQLQRMGLLSVTHARVSSSYHKHEQNHWKSLEITGNVLLQTSLKTVLIEQGKD